MRKGTVSPRAATTKTVALADISISWERSRLHGEEDAPRQVTITGEQVIPMKGAPIELQRNASA